MFAGLIKIVQLLLLHCIVVRSYVLHDDNLTQAELISEETYDETATNTNNDFWWFVKPSGIYEFITSVFEWTYDVLASVVPARSSGYARSFSGIQLPLKSQPLLKSRLLKSQSLLSAYNEPIDQKNTPGEVSKHVKSMLNQLKSISKKITSDDGSSEVLYIKKPSYFNFRILELVSLVYWWVDEALTSSTVDKKSFNESPREHQPSLPAKESDDESEVADLMNAANVSKREGRSLLIQIKAKSSVSEETTKDAKSYSHMPCGSRLFQLHRLQLMINLWLDDVAASNTITNNEISQHPLESQSPSAEEKINNKLKDRERISQFFRIHQLTEMLKQWFDDTFSSNTIVKNKHVVFQPSSKNQPSLLAKENDNRLKDQEKIIADVLKNVKSIVSQFMKEKSKETITSPYDIFSSILFKRPEHNNIQMVKFASIVYWWVYDTLMLNIGKNSSNESPLESQFSLPAKEIDKELKDQKINIVDNNLKRESMLTELKAKVPEETTTKTLERRAINATGAKTYIERLPEEEVDFLNITSWFKNFQRPKIESDLHNVTHIPAESNHSTVSPIAASSNDKTYIERLVEEEVEPASLDTLSNLTSSWFDFKNFHGSKIESDFHNVTHIPAESNHSTVPPITASSDDKTYIKRPPEEEVDPNSFDKLNNLTSSWFDFKNFHGSKIKSDLHNATHIPAESTHSTVPPITPSSNDETYIKRPPEEKVEPDFLDNLNNLTSSWYNSKNVQRSKILRSINNFYHRGPPEEEVEPASLDILNNLTSSWFDFKNFHGSKIESDLHNMTHIPAESNHSTVPSIVASSNNYQIVENTSISETPDVFEYPVHNSAVPPIVASSNNYQIVENTSISEMPDVFEYPVHNSTVPPIVASSNNYQIVENTITSETPDVFEYPVHNSTIPPIDTVTYIASNTMYVHPKSNSTLTRVFAEFFDHFTESSIATSPDNYHQTEKNTPETHNVSDDEVSNDKAGNDDPSIHKTVNFHKNEANNKTFKLKDNVKPSNKVEIYSDYSKVRYQTYYHRIPLPFN